MRLRRLTASPSIGECSTIFDPYGDAAFLVRTIEIVVQQSLSAAGVVIGNYGFGKTHLLYYLYNTVKRRYEKPFLVYVASPRDGIMDLYYKILEAAEKILPDIYPYFSDHLKRIIRHIVEKTEYSEYVHHWLIGENIPLRTKRIIGVHGRVRHDTALEYSLEILSSLYRAGYKPILILIDEFEDILTYSTMKKIRYLSHLRTLADNLPPTSLLLIASTPAGYTETVNIYPALSRRLSALAVYLKPYGLEETRKFLEYYLQRIGLAGDTINDMVVELIHEYSEGNPGEIVRLINILIIKYGDRIPGDIDEIKEVLSEYV